MRSSPSYDSGCHMARTKEKMVNDMGGSMKLIYPWFMEDLERRTKERTEAFRRRNEMDAIRLGPCSRT